MRGRHRQSGPDSVQNRAGAAAIACASGGKTATRLRFSGSASALMFLPFLPGLPTPPKSRPAYFY
jgi:hypothetical protein